MRVSSVLVILVIGFALSVMGGSAAALETSTVNPLGFEGSENTFYGIGAGANTTDADAAVTFIGASAGNQNTLGNANTFVGNNAGFSNDIGFDNTFTGYYSGYSNTGGARNSFVGSSAGFSNISGNGNVFLGYSAGSSETGSNKLYIDNCISGDPCNTPFIYGEFDNRSLRINGAGIGVAGYPTYTVDVSNRGVSRSSLHFSLNGTDTGGWITSVLDNNFWLSSGAMYDGSAPGWIQKSPDGKAVMAGSGGVGYRVFTTSGNTVGNLVPSQNIVARLHIDYSGNMGINTLANPAVAINTGTGAYLSLGGVWTDMSSREAKEDIRHLQAEEALEALEGLSPVKFTYKADRGEKHIGFIAEDVPELVAMKDRKGLSSMDIVAVLTKVIQEQQRTITTLSEKVNKLERTLQSSP